jgi:hypothetical protein
MYGMGWLGSNQDRKLSFDDFSNTSFLEEATRPKSKFVSMAALLLSTGPAPHRQHLQKMPAQSVA